MPVLLKWRHFAEFGFLNLSGARAILTETLKAALGIYPTGHLGWLPGWEEVCYPASNPAAREPAMRWAQVMVVGHALFAVIMLSRGQWLAPLMLSCGPFWNGWLFWLCNSTQHVGLHHGDFATGTVNDFRLTTRTFYLRSALVRFWYWHMNWHTGNSPQPPRARAWTPYSRLPIACTHFWNQSTTCTRRSRATISRRSMKLSSTICLPRQMVSWRSGRSSQVIFTGAVVLLHAYFTQIANPPHLLARGRVSHACTRL